nr:spliceosome-associated protein CWC15 homolog [Manis javanica]
MIAARPTFEPARGGRGKGEGDLSQLSKQHSSRDLPSPTKIKYRLNKSNDKGIAPCPAHDEHALERLADSHAPSKAMTVSMKTSLLPKKRKEKTCNMQSPQEMPSH